MPEKTFTSNGMRTLWHFFQINSQRRANLAIDQLGLWMVLCLNIQEKITQHYACKYSVVGEREHYHGSLIKLLQHIINQEMAEILKNFSK